MNDPLSVRAPANLRAESSHDVPSRRSDQKLMMAVAVILFSLESPFAMLESLC